MFNPTIAESRSFTSRSKKDALMLLLFGFPAYTMQIRENQLPSEY